MCLRGVSLFSVFSCLFTIFSCLFTIFSCLFTIFQIKLTPPKHILALPIQGQICISFELQPKQISNFDLGHPVHVSYTFLIQEFIFSIQKFPSQLCQPYKMAVALVSQKCGSFGIPFNLPCKWPFYFPNITPHTYYVAQKAKRLPF